MNDECSWDDVLNGKLSVTEYDRLRNEELHGLLEKGYVYVEDLLPYLDELTEQQLTFIHALCVFDYKRHIFLQGAYLNPAAADIFFGLFFKTLSVTFGLDELKRFIIRHNIELRDGWKQRLELLESSGIETESTDITPGTRTGTSENKAPSRRKGGNKPKRIWQKLLVKACMKKKITGTSDILEKIKSYLDETELIDDDGNLVSKIDYQDVRHDRDYIASGKFDAYLKKNHNTKKILCRNDAEIESFEKWLGKTFKH